MHIISPRTIYFVPANTYSVYITYLLDIHLRHFRISAHDLLMMSQIVAHCDVIIYSFVLMVVRKRLFSIILLMIALMMTEG